MTIDRHYCTGCPNDPSVPCCHMHPTERVDIHDCKCAALGIKLRPSVEGDERE